MGQEGIRKGAKAPARGGDTSLLVERLTVVCETAVAVHRAPSLDAVYEHAIDALIRGAGADRAAVLLFDQDGHCRFTASRGLSDAYISGVEGHSPWRQDDTGATTVLVPDVAREKSLGHLRAAILAEGIRALAFVPLHGRDRLLGKFMVYFDVPHRLDQEVIEIAETIAENIATAIERMRAEAALEAERRLFIAGPTVAMKWRNVAGWPVEYVSPNVLAEFGYAPAALTAGHVRFAELLHPDDLARVSSEVAAVTANGGEWFQQEYRLRHADGEYRWVYDFTVLNRNEAGEVTHYHGYLQDITDRKWREAEQRQIEQRMQEGQKLESLGVLAGGIAHDFNNLLMGVLGNASLALDELHPGSPARDRIEDIATSARRAAELTRQLLAYSGKARFQVGRLDVSHLVGEMLKLLATVVSKKATVTYDLATGLPPVEADATQLRQVVMNLITNASDALGDRGGSIRVRTGFVEADHAYLATARIGGECTPGPYVFLEITDTGSGMDAEVQRRMFEPFYSTKFAGRGLGLAAVMGIVRGHRGALRVDSSPGRGSSMTLLLPSAGPAADDGATKTHAAAAVATGTVLVVDDEFVVRNVASRMLAAAGFSVLQAANGQEALDLLRGPDLDVTAVVLDLTMPVMGGAETFRALRARWPALPVVLSSGHSEYDAAHRVEPDDHAAFLQKPYTGDMLVETVRQLLARNAH